jgi:predicted Zn-dependent protease
MPLIALAVLVLAGSPLIAHQPSEKEAALGRHLAAEVRRRTTTLENLAIQNYLDRLGQRIAAQFPDPKLPFSFSTIAEDLCPTMHEPVALPGGYVFVPAALFLAAQNEAEFAGMLAHAMAHIAKRHGIRNAVNSGSSPVIFLGGWAGGCSELVPRGFLAAQRSNEIEADLLAVETVAKAGFDPKELWLYVERVQVLGAATRWLPDRDQRLAALVSAIEKLPPTDYAVSASEFAAARQKIRSVSAQPARSAERPAPSLKRAPTPR